MCETNLSPPCGPQQDCHEDHEEGGDNVGDGDAGEEEVEDGVLGDRIVSASGQQCLVWFYEASIGGSFSVPKRRISVQHPGLVPVYESKEGD